MFDEMHTYETIATNLEFHAAKRLQYDLRKSGKDAKLDINGSIRDAMEGKATANVVVKYWAI